MNTDTNNNYSNNPLQKRMINHIFIVACYFSFYTLFYTLSIYNY